MKLSKLAGAVVSILALSACGGGGGSSGSHNNQEEPQPQPVEDNVVVVQDFQFNAFSSLDVAEVITGGNFDANSQTTVCLDLDSDNSCRAEQYSVSGTGLSFSNKLEWPEDLDVSGVNIIADNNNFVYSIPANSGINEVVAQGTSVQKRIKVYINPSSNALHADKLGKDVILGGYTAKKYSSNDFSAQKDYSTLDQEIITFADTLVSVLNNSNKKKLAYTEVRDIVSGGLQKIIDALKDLAVSPVQIVVSVDTYNDYQHLGNNGNPDVPITNNPPVADFKFDVGADGVVNFSNTSSDPENDKLTYKWKFGDNAESNEASPTHKYKSNGKYTVYLNVTDSGNLSSYITKDVNVDSISEGGNDNPDNPDNPVVDENNAPIANFYYEDTKQGLVTFRNDSSDPDNDKLTYKWSFGDGSESSKKSPNHQFNMNGMYTVSLTVTDSHNVASTVTKDVIVASIYTPVENRAPVANFSYSVGNNHVVTFINSSTDRDGDKLTSKWHVDGDELYYETDNFEYDFSRAGTYKVTLTVSDGKEISTVTHEVVVPDETNPEIPDTPDPVKPDPEIPDTPDPVKPDPVNNPPVASFSYSVGNNHVVTFINTSTDSDGDRLSSTWYIQGIGSAYEMDDLEYSFSQAGTYKVTLSVSDGKSVSTIAHDVIVTDKLNPDPLGSCKESTLNLDADVRVGALGLLTFYNKSYDIEENPWTYSWRFDFYGGGDYGPDWEALKNSMEYLSSTRLETREESPQIKYKQYIPYKDEGYKVSLVAKNACGVEKTLDIVVKIPDELDAVVCKSVNYDELRTSLTEATMIGDVECKGTDERVCQWLPDTNEKSVRLSPDKDGVERVVGNNGTNDYFLNSDNCRVMIRSYDDKGRLIFSSIGCGEMTPKTIQEICLVGNGTIRDVSFDDKYVVVNHKKTTLPLLASVDENDIVNINTVSTAVARFGVKHLLGNYTGGEYSEESFSSANSYDLFDNNIKVLGDTVFYLSQVIDYGELSTEDLKTKLLDGLGAIIEAKMRGISDDQILHNVVKYRDYEHLNELQPDLGGNSAPVADAECYFVLKGDGHEVFSLDLEGLSSDPDNDDLSIDWLFTNVPKPYFLNNACLYNENCSYIEGGELIDAKSKKIEMLGWRHGGINLKHERLVGVPFKSYVGHWDENLNRRVYAPITTYYRVSDGKVFKFNSMNCYSYGDVVHN